MWVVFGMTLLYFRFIITTKHKKMKPQNINRHLVLTTFVLSTVVYFFSCKKEVMSESEKQNEAIELSLPGQNASSTSGGCVPGINPRRSGIPLNSFYFIQFMGNPKLNLVLEVPEDNHKEGVIIKLNKYHGGTSQVWSLLEIMRGYYLIIPNLDPNLEIGIPNKSSAPGTKVGLYTQPITFPPLPTPWNLYWTINALGGIGQIYNVKTGLPLSVPYGTTTPGTPVQQLQTSTTWKFIPVPQSLVSPDTRERTYPDPNKPGCYVWGPN
jgi:hypothetical protein